MVLKRYWYKDGVSVLAPLKCGSRWLNDYTKPLAFSKYDSHKDLREYYSGSENINHFVYREPEKHFITAFHTEVLTYARERRLDELELLPTINLFKENRAEHWSTDLWRTLCNSIIDKDVNFKFVNLNNLSSLFEDKYVHNKNEYGFEKNKLFVTKEELLSLLKSKHPKEWMFFNEVIKIEEFWMNRTFYKTENIKLWDVTFTDSLNSEIKMTNETNHFGSHFPKSLI
jgi:hypothetical protein